jgi:neutral ceramidase
MWGCGHAFKENREYRMKKFYRLKATSLLVFLIIAIFMLPGCDNKDKNIKIKVGAAAEDFTDPDPAKQEGRLRATALVIAGNNTKLCIVSCDIITIAREYIDETGKKIEDELGIPFENILITATHTHSGPSRDDPKVIKRLQDAIFASVSKANEKLKTAKDASMHFRLGQEATIGQNSRLLLSDGTVYWYGNYDDAIRPTGSFDPELPVIAFKSEDQKLEAVLFNHSTHTIGARKKGVLSPAFYGLAAQELETEYGGNFIFLLGAHGSIHDLPWTRSTDEKVFRIKEAVKDALSKAEKKDIPRLVSVKKEFEYRVRHFDPEAEEKAVTYYCTKRLTDPEKNIEYFRKKRTELIPHQGELRKTWLQVMVIGDVAIVGTSGELFNDLGIDIKRRSPFRYTYIVDCSNDRIGYIPDKKGFELGGYQLWSCWTSHVAKGTGEKLVDEALKLLRDIYESK